MFYTGFIQTATNSSTTEQFRAQVEHIAYIVAQALHRGADAAEPEKEAVDAYVAHMREMEFDNAQFLRECTPSYYNNEGEDRPRWALIRGYKPGWDAFMAMLGAWRKANELEGLRVSYPTHDIAG
jgi:cyclohexanone monooxygenase